jgi:GMP reductase
LLPRKCRVQSRSECDPAWSLGGRRFKLPVVPANMKTVVDEKICLWLAKNGYFYVMHRFDLDNVAFVRQMHAGQGAYASISVGVKQPDYATRSTAWPPAGLVPEYMTIDIAHGHADSVREMIAHLKAKLPAELRDRRQRGDAGSGDRPGELGRRRDQGGHRPGQGVHHQA